MEEFYPNGKLLSKGNLVNGKKEGKWEFYFDNGNYWGNCEFVNDKPHGYCEYNYITGKTYVKGYYLEGNYNGDWEFFDEDGKLILEERYNNGKLLNNYGKRI